jgi:isoleucyl-tRNA synthetase
MGEVESVHLTEWPVARSEWADRPLLERMRVVQGLAALGQAARDRAELDAAKCLERAQVAQLPGNGHALEELSLFADLLARAVNVEKLELSQQAMGRVKWQLRLDRETTASRSIPFEEIEAALGQLDPSRALDLAMELWQGLSVSVESAGRAVTLLPAEIKVVPEADPGWTAAAGGGYLIVLRVD